MNETIIQAEALTKTFRDFWMRPKITAVDNIRFEIQRGEIFGLLGPNGSGKSTTLKMILGLLHPSAGRITVFGQAPQDVKTKQRIGYLPEESCLYDYLTPEETLHFYGRLFDLDAASRTERVDQLLDMIGLGHARRRPVGEFSKGMARRVGLAQALINDPDLIILDEPTAGLDPVGCRQIKDLILNLAQRGKTVLLSSHLLADVEDVCDRVAILYSGSIRAMGSIHELLEEQTRYQFDLPELPPERIQAVLSSLKELVGEDLDIRHPRINLERFFIRIVEEAQQDSATRSGAVPVTKVADYLTQSD
ncbi:MAG: ABC transporter ATP-binding protein [Kiritimatiellales bacterium]|nr:ABC transporter ATP-binding protein [Kiritimatiellales bacterium]